MKQPITIIIFSILFCACGTSPQNNSMALVLSDTEIIKINPGSPHLIRADMAKTIDTKKLLDMIQSIDYIKLDSSEPIGEISKMVVTRDKIFILDAHIAQQIFVFNKTGKLLFRIKNKGRGPKEYISIWDMQVDTIRNEILLNDALARSYLYFSADAVACRLCVGYFLFHIRLCGVGNDREIFAVQPVEQERRDLCRVKRYIGCAPYKRDMTAD